MRRLAIHQVDAFAERAFEGNPAAVCPLERWLSDELMQHIAAENNLSETAYVVPHRPAGPPAPGVSEWELRWFTPLAEVALCGHATLATAFVLFEEDPARERLRFHTRSGVLEVRRERGGGIELDLPAQPGEPASLPAALRAALGGQPLEVWRNEDYWLALYADADAVRALAPDMNALARDPRGFVVTARAAEGSGFDFVSRMFAPSVGIPEDPVCGSAHCLLVPLWAARLGRTTLVARQVSRRGGTLRCVLAGERVRLAGSAVRVLEGTLLVP